MKWSASPPRAQGKLQTSHVLRKALLHNIKLTVLLLLVALFILKTGSLGINDTPALATLRNSAFQFNTAKQLLLHRHLSSKPARSEQDHTLVYHDQSYVASTMESSGSAGNMSRDESDGKMSIAQLNQTAPVRPQPATSTRVEEATILQKREQADSMPDALSDVDILHAAREGGVNPAESKETHIAFTIDQKGKEALNGSFKLGPRGNPERLEDGVPTINMQQNGDAQGSEASTHMTPLWLTPKITDWDEQRKAWLAQNPLHGRRGADNILLVSSSRPKACDNAHGDHVLLKFMKNKMDYCRLHNIEIFYNMVQMDKDMTDYWSKLPLLRTLMIAHPEIEWLWWMDSDAMFTDMTFELPMAKYQDYNLVMHGWEYQVFVTKSWIGLNAGIFLLRNCQWSLDLIDLWSSMGTNSTIREAAGKVLSEALSDRPLYEADDQSALVYLLFTQKNQTWASKVFLESSYCLHGYWDFLVDRYEELMESSRPGYGDDRWPFITHFVGCKPCAKKGNYAEGRCLEQMERAFNFADNQVMQEYGFKHVSLGTSQVERISEPAGEVTAY